MTHRSRSLLGLSTLLVLASGCGGTPEGRVDVYPVSGKVMIDGKPAAGAGIILYPTVPLADKNADYPRSTVGEDGSYSISTYGEQDGAPVGTYKVSIAKGVGSESEGLVVRKTKEVDLLKNFNDPEKSGLTLEVKGSSNQIPTFELSSSRPN